MQWPDKHATVLIVDDDPTQGRALQEELSEQGFVANWERSGNDALQKLTEEEFDVVLTDLNMPEMDGIELAERIAGYRPDIPVVVITGYGNLDTAVAAMRAGVCDFVTKPVDLAELAAALGRAVKQRAVREQVRRLRDSVVQAERLGGLIGSSSPMKRLYTLMHRIAPLDASVLIVGETGTGKEVVTRALHRLSRRSCPFVPISCAAVPAHLLESVLFGNAQGASTDAKKERTGLLFKANGGTLFLDEIGEMPLELQPKLLRALEERSYRPIGSTEEVAFDARIIAATNRNLETEVSQGRFREDLYFRLNVVRLEMPPLRERGNDILLIAQGFIEHFAGMYGKSVLTLSTEAANKILSYSWPGNVRELRNCIERAVAMASFEEISAEDLPETMRDRRDSRPLSENEDSLLPIDEIERRHICMVLQAVGWNKTKAARVLGFDRKTLYRRLERYDIGTPEKPDRRGVVPRRGGSPQLHEHH